LYNTDDSKYFVCQLFEGWALQKKLQDKNEGEKNDAHQIKDHQEVEQAVSMTIIITIILYM
jgi:hypothetical protein